ncbi:MAG TPA: type II toxin-antitoxin system RelE/ParE family toxin [Longimicrobium sp.]|nr:type II toxin-antitoxin system RelE/ParE family toxin [Longimicrobium sp.]
MKRIRMHAAARQELFEAADWYDERRPGTGRRLRVEVGEIRARIASAPEQGSPHLYGTRRFILQRFPYSTVYLTLDDYGHIIAVAHQSRKPGYWRKRLKDIR